jgi:hypothetical protein
MGWIFPTLFLQYGCMKKLLFTLFITSMLACTENTSNVNISITQYDTITVDTLTYLDSTGIKQIQVLDSLYLKR